MKIDSLKVIQIIGTFFRRVAFCFTLILVLLCIGGIFFGEDSAALLSAQQILTFLIYSFLFAFSFMIADFVKDNAVIKCTVQFVLSYASLLIFILFGGSFNHYTEDLSATDNPDFLYLVFISCVFVGIYVACALIKLLISYVVSRVSNSKQGYEFDNL